MANKDKSTTPRPGSEDAYRKSMFYEQLVEHAFVSEVLQEAWYNFGKTVEVLRSEVDASGYDLVLDCNGTMRHVQLKTSTPDAKAQGQKVNVALASKPSGCIIWVIRHEDVDTCRMRLSYRVFGASPTQPLPSLAGLKTAKHTKANAAGVKAERAAVRIVPKSRFDSVATTRELLEWLFGLG